MFGAISSELAEKNRKYEKYPLGMKYSMSLNYYLSSTRSRGGIGSSTLFFMQKLFHQHAAGSRTNASDFLTKRTVSRFLQDSRREDKHPDTNKSWNNDAHKIHQYSRTLAAHSLSCSHSTWNKPRGILLPGVYCVLCATDIHGVVAYARGKKVLQYPGQAVRMSGNSGRSDTI